MTYDMWLKVEGGQLPRSFGSVGVLKMFSQKMINYLNQEMNDKFIRKTFRSNNYKLKVTLCRFIATKTAINNGGPGGIEPATLGTGGRCFNHYAVKQGKSSAWKMNWYLEHSKSTSSWDPHPHRWVCTPDQGGSVVYSTASLTEVQSQLRYQTQEGNKNEMVNANETWMAKAKWRNIQK